MVDFTNNLMINYSILEADGTEKIKFVNLIPNSRLRFEKLNFNYAVTITFFFFFALYIAIFFFNLLNAHFLVQQTSQNLIKFQS